MNADYQPQITPHPNDDSIDSDQESDEDSTVSESSEEKKMDAQMVKNDQMDAEEKTDAFLWAKICLVFILGSLYQIKFNLLFLPTSIDLLLSWKLF